MSVSREDKKKKKKRRRGNEERKEKRCGDGETKRFETRIFYGRRERKRQGKRRGKQGGEGREEGEDTAEQRKEEFRGTRDIKGFIICGPFDRSSSEIHRRSASAQALWIF